jgi:phospholipid/cholesterol/gamma-HCH transport system substrate-binding protein
METRANYVIVGLFTLAVIAGAFGFVFWFHRSAGTGDRVPYRVLFASSVSGLRTGAAVLFNGIRVGEVTDLQLDNKNPHKVVATISVLRSTPLRSDTDISLEFQGLTGIASLSLKGGTLAAPIPASENGEPPTLVVDPAATQDITQSAREIMRKVDSVITENQEAMRSTLHNMDAFSQALARNSDRIDRIMAGLEHLTGSGDGKGEIPEAVKSMREVADNLEKRVGEISAGINRFTSAGTRQIEALGNDGRRTLSTIEQVVKNFDRNPQRLLFGGGNSTPEVSGRR